MAGEYRAFLARRDRQRGGAGVVSARLGGGVAVGVVPELTEHPDADIYRSLPGLGVILGARVLGEFGDDPNRYTAPILARITPEHHR